MFIGKSLFIKYNEEKHHQWHLRSNRFHYWSWSINMSWKYNTNTRIWIRNTLSFPPPVWIWGFYGYCVTLSCDCCPHGFCSSPNLSAIWTSAILYDLPKSSHDVRTVLKVDFLKLVHCECHTVNQWEMGVSPQCNNL
jgi:hypothetical protein